VRAESMGGTDTESTVASGSPLTDIAPLSSEVTSSSCNAGFSSSDAGPFSSDSECSSSGSDSCFSASRGKVGGVPSSTGAGSMCSASCDPATWLTSFVSCSCVAAPTTSKRGLTDREVNLGDAGTGTAGSNGSGITNVACNTGIVGGGDGESANDMIGVGLEAGSMGEESNSEADNAKAMKGGRAACCRTGVEYSEAGGERGEEGRDGE